MALERLKAKVEEEQEENEQKEPQEDEQEISNDSKKESVEEKKEELQEDYKAIAEARQKEIERLKADKRSVRSFTPMAEQKDEVYSRAELRVFESLREDAFQEFLDANPQYRNDDSLWDKFLGEYQDRISEVEYAKRRKTPVTKRLFKERLESIHKSLGGGMENLKEEGKKELLRSQSEAQILGAASGSGENVDMAKKPERKRILPKKGNGFQDWIPKDRQPK